MSNISSMSQDPNKEEQQTTMVKGTRACTGCRAVKMKCVGADIKSGKPCDRCARQKSSCVFEQHRRGRKPGSMMSESSKMLRRLEKRLGTNKAKGAALKDRNAHWVADGATLKPYTYSPDNDTQAAGLRFDDQSDEEDENGPLITPAMLIKQEYKRQTSLELDTNPSNWAPPVLARDPVSAGIIDEATVHVLFELFFVHVNQFICLFDPALHTVDYVRTRSPFLLTVLLMASCKFFKPEAFHQCQGLAQELAAHALAGDWKSVEIVQAFACLCYWEEPGHTRTWTYIGHACRMAIEMGMNRSKQKQPSGNDETELQRRERRNRERTYLVLFVHDRSLAMHTGRPWMLPEDELVRTADRWYEQCSDESLRPRDIVVSSMVQLRCRLIKTTENLRLGPVNSSPQPQADDVERLQSSNAELMSWITHWDDEMRRSGGSRVHVSLLRCMWLYVRVLSNSYFLKSALSANTSILHTVVSTCYESALESLRIAYGEFSPMNVLRYGQDSLTLMNAYSAAFLVRLLRRADTRTLMHASAAFEIQQAINRTANAYETASASSSACSGLMHHVQFLRSLTAQSIFRAPTYAFDGTSSFYAPGQPPQQEQPGSWAAAQPSTSNYNHMMYAPSWDMAALTQTYSHSPVVPQGVTALPDVPQQQYSATYGPISGEDHQSYWGPAYQNAQSQVTTLDPGIHAQAYDDGWQAF
ncbi:unnamed protein product [Peniophora sp. CBMAI 1063]|nr:unnamed protein product [Peniophora sp. CBMAI 1063]